VIFAFKFMLAAYVNVDILQCNWNRAAQWPGINGDGALCRTAALYQPRVLNLGIDIKNWQKGCE
jgi:hypothetical protein